MEDRAADEERDGDDLHDENGVEVALGIVERAVRDRELHAGEDRHRHRAPAEQPPAPAERPERLPARLAGQRARVGHGHEDEDDRAADPDRGGEHVQGEEDDVHGSRGYRDAPCAGSAFLSPRNSRSRSPLPPPARGIAVVTLSGAGDIAMAPSGSGAAGFFDSGIRKALRADISLGNLEGTLATGGSSKCGPKSTDCYAFRAPPSYSTALKRAGFTIMNLANNHAFDFGASAQAETIAALKRAGLRFTGRPGEIAVLRKRRDEGRVRRLRAVSLGAGPARHRGRREARAARPTARPTSSS